jgi:ABC-2 type transport system permease protein
MLPQIVTWTLMGLFCLFLLYGAWRFPLNSGIWPMLLDMFLLVNASLALGVFFCGLVPSLRWALSLATLWGVLSFPISGFSFPHWAFPDTLKGLAWLFPLRHYFLIYVDQALNGLPMYYSYLNYAALVAFLILPFLLPNRLKKCLLEYQYTK